MFPLSLKLNTIYWICFIFGGIFVLLSAMGGIDGVDVEHGEIGDTDFDGDGGPDHDFDIDRNASSFVNTDLEWSQPQPRVRQIWQILSSFKFWTFGLCFFGLTGLVLSRMQISDGLVLALAIGMGVAMGTGMAAALRYLYRRRVDSLGHIQDVVGRVGIIEIPFNSSSRGRVRFKVKGVVVDYTAFTEDADELTIGQSVLAVKFENNRLWVTATF
jgi:hypothetical protein